jgi:Tol biopolymer transport system component
MFRIVLTALVALAALGGSDAHGATAPQIFNGRIAFSESTGIASMNPDGSGQWGVELQVGDTQPAWSPDGTKLAVVTHWAGRNGIELLQPNGDALGMLTTDGGDAFPAWSSDGKTVAFTNGPNVFLIGADGSNRRKLTSDDVFGFAYRPTWSADGTTIAYASFRGSGGTHIYAVNVATGMETALTSGFTYDAAPAWSPDGSTIVFTSARGPDEGIYAMNADGTGVRMLTSGTIYADDAAWSPDGTQIAFTSNSQIWVMNADGGNPHQIGKSNDYDGYPAWQPLAAPPAGCTLWGTSANDLLVGSDGVDRICGLDGNDTIVGLGGDDTLQGGNGDDFIAAGLGRNYVFGDAGDDTIDARNGSSDIVMGGTGVDTCIISGLRGTFMSSVERPRVDGDLAAWLPASADAFSATNPPQLAFDGLIQDWWNAGSYPPHWVEVDLQYPRAIGRIQLIAPQLGSDAIVLLLGRSADD